MHSRPLPTILVVDDDDVDVRSITRALRRGEVENPVVVAEDGPTGLQLMRGEGPHDLGWPFIVILDLNLPGLNGHEVLDRVRRDPALKGTVVFVLSTSSNERDIVAAYDRQVAGYIPKTGAGSDLGDLVTMIRAYSNAVRFPSAAPSLPDGAPAPS